MRSVPFDPRRLLRLPILLFLIGIGLGIDAHVRYYPFYPRASFFRKPAGSVEWFVGLLCFFLGAWLFARPRNDSDDDNGKSGGNWRTRE